MNPFFPGGSIHSTFRGADNGSLTIFKVHQGAYVNPFFNTVPPGMLYPSLIIAILAAIVASQAIITATFQVIFHSQLQIHEYADLITVDCSSHEVIILPSDQGSSYLESLSWTA